MNEENTQPVKDPVSRYSLPLISVGLIIFYFAAMSLAINNLLPEDFNSETDLIPDFALFGGVVLNALLCSLALGVVLSQIPFRGIVQKSLKYKAMAVVYGWLAAIVVSIGFGLLFHLFDYIPEPQQVAKRIAAVKNEYVYLVILGPALLVPLVEEIIFRGFLYRSLVDFYRYPADAENRQLTDEQMKKVKLVAMVMASAIFALVHMEIHTMPQLFVLGFIFNYAYEKTGSITVATCLHILNNIFGIIFLLLS